MDRFQQEPIFRNRFFNKPSQYGFLVFLVVLGSGVFLTLLSYQLLSKNEEEDLENLMTVVTQNIRQSLDYSQSAAFTLAMGVSSDGISPNIDEYAAQIIDNNTYLDAVQLVPDGVIQYVYPLAGNEPIIGYDILSDTLRNREAYEAIEKRQIVFSGPYELKQGGTGIVGRIPIFIDAEFWGFSAVVIRLETLVRLSGMDISTESPYYYQFSKVNPNTGELEYFLPQRSEYEKNVSRTTFFPEGSWNLTIYKSKMSNAIFGVYFLGLMSLILSVVSGISVTNVLKKPYELEKMVKSQAKEISKTNQKNAAILKALPDLLFILDKNGVFLDYHKPQGMSTLRKPEEFLGKKIEDVMPDTYMQEVQGKLEEALKGSQLVEHEYSLDYPTGKRDFEARYVKCGLEEVLVIVRDVTQEKQASDQLKQSELRYRELVEQASDGIFLIDDQGIILDINASGLEMSGYDKSDVIGKSIDEFFIKEDDAMEQQPFQSLKQGEQIISTRKIKAKSGEVLTLEISAKVLKDNQIQGIARNVTERIRYIQAIEEQNTKLKEIAWMQSHAVRAPLARILGLADYIKFHASAEEREEMLLHLIQSSKELDNVIKEIVKKSSQINEDSLS